MWTVVARILTANAAIINLHKSVWAQICDLFHNGARCTKGCTNPFWQFKKKSFTGLALTSPKPDAATFGLKVNLDSDPWSFTA